MRQETIRLSVCADEHSVEVTPGSHVAPGENFTYTWKVLDGPSASDSSCVPYLYYSATDPVMDTNSGLVGPLLVCKKGTLAQEETQVKQNWHQLYKCVFESRNNQIVCLSVYFCLGKGVFPSVLCHG